jgi:ubiquinone biosynthesis protein UbiJ
MDESEIRRQLKDVDAELARLREDVAAMRREIGERWDAPTDAAELATVLTNVEQQESLIETLEARRERLLQKLGSS